MIFPTLSIKTPATPVTPANLWPEISSQSADDELVIQLVKHETPVFKAFQGFGPAKMSNYPKRSRRRARGEPIFPTG
jgi:hypothetical protein